MNKKSFDILIILLLTSILPSIHHLFDNFPVFSVDLFLFCDHSQDIQWYVKDTFDMIVKSLLYFIIYKSLNVKLVKELSLYLFIFSLTDIVGYWLYFGQYTYLTMSTALLFWAVSNLLMTTKSK